MVKAKDKFIKGQRVKMSPLGYQRLTPGKVRTGVVFGFCRSPWSVQIKIDGLKTPQGYWVGFWSKI